MTATAKGVAYNNTTGKSGYGFNGEVPIITSNYQTVAEFSGGTNPKDVVTHEQLALAIQVYKVGDIYITTSSQDPAIKFGYGVWERFAEGRTLVGYSSDVTSATPDWLKTINNKYGEYEHKLTVDEIPSHKHEVRLGDAITSGEFQGGNHISSGGALLQGLIDSDSLQATGGNQPHNNVQPSIVVYFWKRVE